MRAHRLARACRGVATFAACGVVAFATCGVVAFAACGGGEPRLGKARLAEADALEPLPAGPMIELLPPPPEPAAPVEVPAGATGPVRLVIDRDVLYHRVAAAADAVVKAGAQPVLIVSRRGKLGILPRPSVASAEAIRLVAYSDGRACVSPPGVEDATCVVRDGGKHVDRAFVRELIRRARKEYGIGTVRVVLSPTLSWGDAVRAIDGARTCCAEPMDVSVEMLN